MAPGIAYSGVGEAEGDGIFKGLKFWIAQRVPMRSTWVERIESNGGSVVKLDKLADMIIADHKRKDAPPGSYSWKLIDDSVKEGKLADPETYLIGRPLGASRPVASSQPTKGTRTPFTKQDDDILVAWVMPYFRRGERTAGNEIYQQLEQKYPHHTFQSWRDRWVKKLRHIHETNAAAASASQMPAPPPAPAQKSPSRPPAKQALKKIAPESRVKFTEEDDDLLLLYVRERVGDRGIGADGNKIYQEFAEDFPHHSWQSWRDRFIRHLRPRLEASESREEEATLSPAKRKSPQKTPTQSPQQPKQAVSATPSKDIQQRQHQNSRSPAAAEIQNKDFQQTETEDAEVGLSTEDGQEDPVDDEEHSSDLPPADPRTNRQQFFDDLKSFMESNEDFINLWPQVNGHAIDLFDLYQKVTADNPIPEHRNWEQIAEALDFDWIEDPSILDNLQTCYEKHLGEFELALQEFEDIEEDAEGDGSEEDEEATACPPTAAMRSSPPVVTGLKRSMEMAMMSDASLDPETSTRKRSRRDPHGEIPSTPDEKLGIRRPQKLAAPLPMPKTRDIIASPELDSVRESSQQLPPRTRIVHQPQVEPETQWFDAQTQQQEDDVFFDDGLDITPSQQLRSEIEQVSPIPYRLQKRDNGLASTTQGSRSGNGMSEKARGKLPMRVSEPLSRSRDMPSRSQNEPSTEQKAKRRTLPSSFGVPRPTPPSVQPQPARHIPRPTEDEEESMFVQDDDPSPEPVRPMQTAPHSLTALRAAALPNVGTRHRSSPQLPPTKTPPTTEQNKLAETIDHFISIGYPENIVIQGLKAATMNVGLAGSAMESLMAGKGIPTHHEGIWTQRDDQALELVDSAMDSHGKQSEKEMRKIQREWRRLSYKHGVERIEERRKFLSMMDA